MHMSHAVDVLGESKGGWGRAKGVVSCGLKLVIDIFCKGGPVAQ